VKLANGARRAAKSGNLPDHEQAFAALFFFVHFDEPGVLAPQPFAATRSLPRLSLSSDAHTVC